MSYVQLKPSHRDISFEWLFLECTGVLGRLGYKVSNISGAWLCGSAMVLYCYKSNGFHVIGNRGSDDLSVQKGGDYYQFICDFLCRVGTQVFFDTDQQTFDDHFVSPEATLSQVVDSITTRLGHKNFRNVYIKFKGRERFQVPELHLRALLE